MNFNAIAKKLAAFIAIVVAMAISGTMDYNDSKNEAKHYDEMVCGGNWPDYKNLKPECGNHKRSIIHDTR